MGSSLKDSAEKVQQVVSDLGYEFTIVEFDASTRTSKDAAAAIGCTVSQIAKSLIFRSQPGNQPVLVITSGPNRVNEALVGDVLGEKIGKADAEFVRETTGFAIGGIPPVGHLHPIRTFIDIDLFQHEVIWAAAGTPNAVFRLTPDALKEMTNGEVIAIH
jgi:prolyl-tRNA editing enzyme YbaK/EbsC (Cys-tRNA(Pro) deacylase)